MEMVGGDFGKGTVLYLRFGGSLDIMPNSLFTRGLRTTLDAVESFERVSANTEKKLGETAGLGLGGAVLAGALFGPIGALAGAVTGGLAGGRRDYVVGVILLKDGRRLAVKCRLDELVIFETDLQSLRRPAVAQTVSTAPKREKPARSVSQERGVTADSVGKKRRSSKGAIEGRKKGDAKLPEFPTIMRLQTWIAQQDSEKTLGASNALSAIMDVNDYKYRYNDDTITKGEIRGLLFAVVRREQKRVDDLYVSVERWKKQMIEEEEYYNTASKPKGFFSRKPDPLVLETTRILISTAKQMLASDKLTLPTSEKLARSSRLCVQELYGLSDEAMAIATRDAIALDWLTTAPELKAALIKLREIESRADGPSVA